MLRVLVVNNLFRVHRRRSTVGKLHRLHVVNILLGRQHILVAGRGDRRRRVLEGGTCVVRAGRSRGRLEARMRGDQGGTMTREDIAA